MHEPEPRSPDPLGRAGALAIAAGRIGVGVAALSATRPALRALGLGTADGTVVLARMAGIRDLVLGVHALSVRDDARALAQGSALAALADAGDLAAFAALSRSRGVDRTVLMNGAAAAFAAVAGAYVSRRLR
jgi:hypothetical protein